MRTTGVVLLLALLLSGCGSSQDETVLVKHHTRIRYIIQGTSTDATVVMTTPDGTTKTLTTAALPAHGPNGGLGFAYQFKRGQIVTVTVTNNHALGGVWCSIKADGFPATLRQGAHGPYGTVTCQAVA